MAKLIIIDGNALIHRAFHALPPLKTKKGRLVNAVYGFVTILFRIIKDLQPDYLVATFDLEGPTFRSLEYKEYKAKRVRAPQELYDQIPLIKEFLKSFDILICEKKGFEADDVIGTIVAKMQRSKAESIIVTGDYDTLQLVDQKTKVYALKGGIKNSVMYDAAAVKERYGLIPEQLIDYRGLKGDPSDNIPGVAGVGEKTAVKLIQEFGSIENLYKKVETSSLNPKLKARLLEYKKDALFSRYLSEIRTDVPVEFTLQKSRWKGYNKEKVIKFLTKLNFESLTKRLP